MWGQNDKKNMGYQSQLFVIEKWEGAGEKSYDCFVHKGK